MAMLSKQKGHQAYSLQPTAYSLQQESAFSANNIEVENHNHTYLYTNTQYYRMAAIPSQAGSHKFD